MRLNTRVAALEGRQAPQAFHCIKRYLGQTDEEAFAAYEAVNGPIDRDGPVLWVVIQKPFPCEA